MLFRSYFFIVSITFDFMVDIFYSFFGRIKDTLRSIERKDRVDFFRRTADGPEDAVIKVFGLKIFLEKDYKVFIAIVNIMPYGERVHPVHVIQIAIMQRKYSLTLSVVTLRVFVSYRRVRRTV